ncbi:MAG: response regulator transcription factor [Candidatus Thiodiazotropha sp.]|jgi:DNA-binding NarL/FixJ family response regulator
MQLSTNPDTDEISDLATSGNENRKADIGSDSEQRVIPIANRILLCSSDEDISHRWHESLVEVGELSVVTSREALVSNLKTYQAEVVLVDLELFAKDYRKLPEILCQCYPNVSFIVLSPMPNDDEGLYLISHGVKGYCNRYISRALLVKAVELVRMNEVWVGRSLLFKLMNRLSMVSLSKDEDQNVKGENDAKLAKLSDREREIAQLVGAGDSNKVIAKKLDITERTVKAHLSSIFRKTTTKDRLQLGLLINS